jgi:rubrerythrin
MSLDPNLRPFQIIAAAIRAEIDAADFYTKLQEKVKNEVLLQKLKFLSYEEQQHKRILEKLFAQRYPAERLDVPANSPLPPIGASLGGNASVFDLFKAALAAEELSEKVYGEAAFMAGNEENRHIFSYLSRVERSHAAMIRSEIDLLAKFPDYYQVEDFHVGQDLFHVGP